MNAGRAPAPTICRVPVVTLRPPLRDLAAGAGEVRLDGSSVGETLRELERRHPPIAGWILDEHGRIRRHVNVFLEGERVREEQALSDDAVLHVLSAISGGAR